MDWLLNDPNVVASIAALKAAAVVLAVGVLSMLARILWGLRPLLEMAVREWIQNLLNKRLGDAAARQVGDAITQLGSAATPEALKAQVPAMVEDLSARLSGTLVLANASADTAERFVKGEMGKLIAGAKQEAAAGPSAPVLAWPTGRGNGA
jgi:hypothetical protein